MFGTLLNLLTTRLPKLLTQRPDLLVDHVLAYSALASREIEAIKRQLLRRVVAGAIALACALAFVVLAGVALMLDAVGLAQSQLQGQADRAWVLLAVPGVMLVLALVATMVALAKGKVSTESLAAQVQLDLHAFRAVMEPAHE